MRVATAVDGEGRVPAGLEVREELPVGRGLPLAPDVFFTARADSPFFQGNVLPIFSLIDARRILWLQATLFLERSFAYDCGMSL